MTTKDCQYHYLQYAEKLAQKITELEPAEEIDPSQPFLRYRQQLLHQATNLDEALQNLDAFCEHCPYRGRLPTSLADDCEDLLEEGRSIVRWAANHVVCSILDRRKEREPQQ